MKTLLPPLFAGLGILILAVNEWLRFRSWLRHRITFQAQSVSQRSAFLPPTLRSLQRLSRGWL
jgi:hypothetical protein